MAKLIDLIPEVRTHLAGAADPTVTLYLRRAAKQFCQDSKIWDVNIGSKAVTPPADTDSAVRYVLPSEDPDDDFTLPAQSYINSISTVRLDDNEVDVKGYAFDLSTRELVMQARTILQAATLYVGAVLETARKATALPDFIFELWGDGIADYAVWEMMTMPKQEWSDPVLAEVFKKKYDDRVAEATVAKAREGTEKPIELLPFEFT